MGLAIGTIFLQKGLKGRDEAVDIAVYFSDRDGRERTSKNAPNEHVTDRAAVVVLQISDDLVRVDRKSEGDAEEHGNLTFKIALDLVVFVAN